ncbi:HAD-IC family P-type ATPase [Micromonospora sp. NPDC023814]|uniref:HAD-IC family P-type ATPase n=1 Tax=Micromonospora sp. NPDC023814 TaxID=3154596 RepID=UPI0033FBAD45
MHPLTEGVTAMVTPSAPWWRYLLLSIDQQLVPGRAGGRAGRSSSEHPLARAVVAAARDAQLPLPPSDAFTSTPGRGVTAHVDGYQVDVGSPVGLLESHDDPLRAIVDELEQAGRTAVMVQVDGEPVGVLGLADKLRADAAATVAQLTVVTGARPLLLTGDNERAARRLAAEVGITDVRAGLLPQDKVTAVRELENHGDRVILVGDGVNDAPALAAAHAGVAMGRAGADLALDTADTVITRDELATLPAVIQLARRARRLVIANLAIAGTFIAVLVAWDLIGTLPLPLGVAGHEGSTIIVGLNGLRLLRRAAWDRAATPAAP